MQKTRQIGRSFSLRSLIVNKVSRIFTEALVGSKIRQNEMSSANFSLNVNKLSRILLKSKMHLTINSHLFRL